MSDLISRQAVLDAITASINQFGGRYTAEQLNMWGLFTQMVQELPSAEPERKKPDHGYMWICPECGLEVHSDFRRCVRCGWDRPSADFSCDGCQTPKHICGICRRNYPNITDHYCTGEA